MMKKITILIAAVLMVGLSANAALVVTDGDFEGVTFAKNATAKTDFTQANTTDEWWSKTDSGNTPLVEWVIANDGDDYAFKQGRYKAAMFQAVTDGATTYTGVFDLNFEYQKVGSGNIKVGVWGFNSGGTFSIPSNDFDPTTNYDNAISVSSGLTLSSDTSGWTAGSLSFDLGSTGYDTVIIGFQSDNDTKTVTTDISAIDNVTIPEPATLGLIASAGLAMLLFRRRMSK